MAEAGRLACLAFPDGMQDVVGSAAGGANQQLHQLAKYARLVPGYEGDSDAIRGQQLAQQHRGGEHLMRLGS
jgi:hypothetical protein